MNYANGTFHSLLPVSSALNSLDPNLRIHGAAGLLIQQGMEERDALDQARTEEQKRRRYCGILRASILAAQQAGTISTASVSNGASTSIAGMSGMHPNADPEAFERATLP